jgi:hypothetical protein
MIHVDEKEQMRRDCFTERKTIREIARGRHHSRDTVRQALTEPSPTEYHLQVPRQCPVMGPYQDTIDPWLLDDGKRLRKQRHTAQRILDRLEVHCSRKHSSWLNMVEIGMVSCPSSVSTDGFSTRMPLSQRSLQGNDPGMKEGQP